MRNVCAIALAGMLCLLGSDRPPNPRTLPLPPHKKHSHHHRSYRLLEDIEAMRFC
jgi:hypothetical protein